MVQRILVCGGRDYKNRDHVYATLYKLLSPAGHPDDPRHIIVHGAARGVDTFAGDWAEYAGWRQEKFPVTNDDWRRWGNFAGIRRNAIMLQHCMLKGNLVRGIAFPGGTGTADMVRRLREKNILVTEISDAA